MHHNLPMNVPAGILNFRNRDADHELSICCCVYESNTTYAIVRSVQFQRNHNCCIHLYPQEHLRYQSPWECRLDVIVSQTACLNVALCLSPCRHLVVLQQPFCP